MPLAPFPIEIADEHDDLALLWTSSLTGIATVLIRMRVRNKIVEPIEYTFDHAGTRLTEIEPISVPVGEVIGVQVTRAGKRGQTYVGVYLRRKGRIIQRISRGYVYDGGDVAMGQDDEPGPGGGEGFIRVIALGDPAADIDYVDQTVPTNALWRTLAFEGTLVADANAANRRFHIDVSDGTNEVLAQEATNIQVASQTVVYIGSPGNRHGLSPSSSGVTTAQAFSYIPLPEFNLPEAFVLDFVTDARQATDNWGAGFLTVMEWLVI